jgi:hypothetical protein
MKHLLSFSLAAIAALSVTGCATPSYTIAQTAGGSDCRRLAQPGDTKIKIYCSDTIWSATSHKPAFRPAAASQPQVSGDTRCRWVAKPTDKRIRNICGDTAQWDQFDSDAISAGVTCRWTSFRPRAQPEELCLNVAGWRSLDSGPRGGAIVAGANWPGNDSVRTNTNVGMQPGTGGGSYGYFPAGTAIGAEAGGRPPP